MSEASYMAMNTAAKNRSSNSSISNLGNQFIESGINLSNNSSNIATEVSKNKGLWQTVGWSFTTSMSVYAA